MIHRFVDLVTGYVMAYRRVYFDTTDQIESWLLPGPAQVTSYPSGGVYDGDPILSPDGTKVAFIGVNNDLYVVDADGSNMLLLDNTLTTHGITWHPDGSKILYRVGANIRTINPDGTGLTTLVTQTSLQAPVYNFDASRVAYYIDNANPTPDELWIADADGSNATQVAVAVWTGAGTGAITSLSWANTQDVLCYQKSDGSGPGAAQLWTINGDGTGETQITSGTFSVNRQAWAPDDSVIIAFNNATLYSVDPAGGGATSLGISRDNTGAGGPEVWDGRVYYVDAAFSNLRSCGLDGSDDRKEDGDDFTTFYCALAEDYR